MITHSFKALAYNMLCQYDEGQMKLKEIRMKFRIFVMLFLVPCLALATTTIKVGNTAQTFSKHASGRLNISIKIGGSVKNRKADLVVTIPSDGSGNFTKGNFAKPSKIRITEWVSVDGKITGKNTFKGSYDSGMPADIFPEAVQSIADQLGIDPKAHVTIYNGKLFPSTKEVTGDLKIVFAEKNKVNWTINMALDKLELCAQVSDCNDQKDPIEKQNCVSVITKALAEEECVLMGDFTGTYRIAN